MADNTNEIHSIESSLKRIADALERAYPAKEAPSRPAAPPAAAKTVPADPNKTNLMNAGF